MEGYCLPPIMFSEEEANALITSAAFIAKNKDISLIENHTKAISKIKAVLRYSNKDKANLLS
jgi:predicted DNA-binding transcriptional regulator YafY